MDNKTVQQIHPYYQTVDTDEKYKIDPVRRIEEWFQNYIEMVRKSHTLCYIGIEPVKYELILHNGTPLPYFYWDIAHDYDFPTPFLIDQTLKEFILKHPMFKEQFEHCAHTLMTKKLKLCHQV